MLSRLIVTVYLIPSPVAEAQPYRYRMYSYTVDSNRSLPFSLMQTETSSTEPDRVQR